MSIQKEKSVVTLLEPPLAVFTINRPQYLNALNSDVLLSLEHAFAEVHARDDIRAVIITGAGEKAFVAGADIAAMHDLGPRAIADYVELGQRTMRTIERSPLPVIAAVNGFALGGGLELALACDIIIASDSAKVGQPEVNLGIIPGFGGTQRLLQRTGTGTAKYLCLTGEIITATEAHRLHIIDQIVAADDLISCARSLGQKIAEKGPRAVAGVKKVIRTVSEISLNYGLRVEVEEFLSVFASKDREEGMRAFMQKRKAEFTGE